MSKFTKRALSLIISLAIIISIMPSIVFATEGAVEKLTIKFDSSTFASVGNNSTAPTPSESANFTVVGDKVKKGALVTNSSWDFIQVKAFQSSGNAKSNWVEIIQSGYYGTFTIKSKDTLRAGTYRVKFTGGIGPDLCMTGVFADGQFAGFYDGRVVGSTYDKGTETALGYIELDTDKQVEIMFFNASGTNGYKMHLAGISFERVEAAPQIKGIVCEIPDSIAPEDSFTIAPKIVYDNGEIKPFYDWTTARAKDTNNNITVTSVNSDVLGCEVLWDGAKSASMTATGGQYQASFTGKTAGEADIKITAKVNGVPYTAKKTVWVIDPDNPPTEFTLKVSDNFTRGTNTHPDVSGAVLIDNSWGWNGFSLNEELTSGKGYGSDVDATAQANKTGKKLANIRLNVGTKTYEEASEMIVFTKNVPVEGWYKVNVDGSLGKRGGVFAIYADEQYLGTYNFNNGMATDTYDNGDAIDMNTVYLPKGEVDISFRAVEIPYSDPAIYLDQMTFTAWQPADTDAEDIDNKISYIVRAEDTANNGNITVSDTTYTVNGTNVGEWTVGKSFTATADPDGFAYWANPNGAPISTSASYTFKPTSNFTLEAVYAPASAAAKKVQFWNYNKVFLGEKGVNGDKVESMPTNPSLNGYTFTEWVADGMVVFDANTTIEDAITRVVAQFTKNAAGFSVGGETKAYDDTFSKTAEDTDGENEFSYWTIDGQIASYNKTLSFNVWDTVNVEAVYEGAKTAVPTVVLDKVDHTNSPDEYFIAYEVPAGYTAVDAGIVFSINGIPSVNSADSKASMKSAGAKGQFTAAPGDDTHTVARGYVMYTDNATGSLRVLYTEVK